MKIIFGPGIFGSSVKISQPPPNNLHRMCKKQMPNFQFSFDHSFLTQLPNFKVPPLTRLIHSLQLMHDSALYNA